MTFGYWLETVTDREVGTTNYRVGVYTPLAGARSGTINAAVTGSAMYQGPAAGLFAKREYHPESGGEIVVAGRFTARAELEVDFDRADFVDADGSIDGTISNFMHQGEAIDPRWMVKMSEGTVDADAAGGASFVSTAVKQADGSHWTGDSTGITLTTTILRRSTKPR